MDWITDNLMAKLPPPSYLVQDLIVSGSACALVSAPNVGKTFLAIDLSFCVALGLPWHGFETKQGPVIYVIAEGEGSFGNRLAAWRQENHLADDAVPAGIHIWRAAVQLAHFPDRMEFLTKLSEVPKPSLIVVDTLARCFVGRDENAAADMGLFVQGIDILREVSGATVLVLHHTGHAQRDRRGNMVPAQRERGSTALRGAVDTLLFLEPGVNKNDIVMSVQKQREGETGDPLALRLRVVEIPDVYHEGETLETCVVEDAPFGMTGMKLPPSWIEAMEELAKHDAGATSKEWFRMTKMSRATYHRMRRVMLNDGLITMEGDRCIVKKLPTAEGTNGE